MPRHRLALDLAPLREVGQRPPRTPDAAAAARGRRRDAGHQRLRERLHVVLVMRPFGPVPGTWSMSHAQLARQAPHRRRRRRGGDRRRPLGAAWRWPACEGRRPCRRGRLRRRRSAAGRVHRPARSSSVSPGARAIDASVGWPGSPVPSRRGRSRSGRRPRRRRPRPARRHRLLARGSLGRLALAASPGRLVRRRRRVRRGEDDLADLDLVARLDLHSRSPCPATDDGHFDGGLVGFEFEDGLIDRRSCRRP